MASGEQKIVAARRRTGSLRDSSASRIFARVRYIGNKTKLLDFIQHRIRRRGIDGSAVDPFSGTASVGHRLKRLGFRVTASGARAVLPSRNGSRTPCPLHLGVWPIPAQEDAMTGVQRTTPTRAVPR
jgi:hypothetical protein